MNHLNKLHLITCNNILHHLCTNANHIARIEVITGKFNLTSSEIEQYLNDYLNYLVVNQLIVKTTSIDYEITDKGKNFYRDSRFNV